MVIRRSRALIAGGVLGTIVSACSFAPEPPLDPAPATAPLPPRRPRIGPERRVETRSAPRQPVVGPRGLRVQPRPGLDTPPHLRPGLGPPPTTRPDPPPVATPAPAEGPSPPSERHEGWGVPIPGSVPIQPGGWTPAH